MAKEVIEAEIKSNVAAVAKDTKDLATESKKAKSGVEGIGTAFTYVGRAIKAAGIGLVVALLAKLMEVFSKNQKVLDAFDTGMTFLSITFNDLFTFLSNNVGKVIGWFKSIFEDPQQSIRDFGKAIKENIIERFESWLESVGFLASAVKKLFARDFKGAMDDVKNAGKEMVDVWTGVDNSVDKLKKTVTNAANAVIDYTKSTYDQAKAITELNKAAQLAAVEFAKLNAEFLRDAEIQRQIRDDETKTFKKRIEANLELDKILEKQHKAQKAQLQIQIDAAQAQKDINNSIENRIVLGEAKNAMIELEEAITGQLSEQKTNQVSLEKELLETQNEIRAEGLSGMEKELQELETAYKLKLEMARKSGMKTAAITKQYEKQKTAIVQANMNEQLEAFSGLAGALSALAGDNKALAVASAVIDTYVGANKAFAQGGMLGYVTAAAVIVAGLNNVRTILSTPIPDSGGGVVRLLNLKSLHHK